MTYLSDLRLEILRTLRQGPLGPVAIATATDAAPFMVSAELRAMKRDRQVIEVLDQKRHLFALTGTGLALGFEADQLRLA